MEKIYSSKQVDVDVQIYDKADERYFQDEKLSAQILMSTRNKRLKIRDYNNSFNKEKDYRGLL
jgi:hypothetical protein